MRRSTTNETNPMNHLSPTLRLRCLAQLAVAAPLLALPLAAQTQREQPQGIQVITTEGPMELSFAPSQTSGGVGSQDGLIRFVTSTSSRPDGKCCDHECKAESGSGDTRAGGASTLRLRRHGEGDHGQHGQHRSHGFGELHGTGDHHRADRRRRDEKTEADVRVMLIGPDGVIQRLGNHRGPCESPRALFFGDPKGAGHAAGHPRINSWTSKDGQRTFEVRVESDSHGPRAGGPAFGMWNRRSPETEGTGCCRCKGRDSGPRTRHGRGPAGASGDFFIPSDHSERVIEVEIETEEGCGSSAPGAGGQGDDVSFQLELNDFDLPDFETMDVEAILEWAQEQGGQVIEVDLSGLPEESPQESPAPSAGAEQAAQQIIIV